MNKGNEKSSRTFSQSVATEVTELGEYLLGTLMIMLAAVGRWFKALFGRFGEKFARLGTRIGELLKRFGAWLAAPFIRHAKAMKLGRAEVKKASEQGFGKGVAAGFKLAGRVIFGKRGIAVTLCNWALPVICCGFLFNLISYANNMTYALKLYVNNELMGYVEDESVFKEAEKIVHQRITYLDSSTEMFTFDSRYEVEMNGTGATLTKYQLANNILSTLDAELVEAYGMYIDNSFYGALESKDRIEQTLEALLDKYREGGEERVEFASKITFEPGLYLKSSVVSDSSIIRLITSKNQIAAYYDVVEGDSPLGILAKLDMTEEELAALNPGFSLESSLMIGDQFKITQEEPYLAVTVTRRETYENKISFDTEYVDDPTHYEGSSTVTREGEYGIELVTADVSYINGTETRRRVISTESVSDPVSKIVAVGTKKLPVGVTATIPSNMPVGQMLWPVGGADGGLISEMPYGYGGYYGHKGVDIVAPYGTPIYAAENGTVILAQWYYGYGNCVMIQHDNGLVTVYGHASYLHVYVGQRVTMGDIIADVGSTGDSTANHLHFEVRINGVCQYPLNYLPWHQRAPWCVEY